MPARGGPFLSIVVPALDEAEGIDVVLDAALAAVETAVAAGCLAGGEVVVVDDGSVDDTASVVALRAASDGRVVLVRHPRNRGLGAAIRTGLDRARGDLVLYTDADLPVDLAALVPALALLTASGADLVAGRRRVRAGDGPRRRLYTVGYDLVVRLALGVVVHDVNFAFKLFHRERARALGLRSDGSFIDAELVARTVRTGGRLAALELEYLPRRWGASTLGGRAAIASILRDLWAQGREIRALRPAAEARR